MNMTTKNELHINVKIQTTEEGDLIKPKWQGTISVGQLQRKAKASH